MFPFIIDNKQFNIMLCRTYNIVLEDSYYVM